MFMCICVCIYIYGTKSKCLTIGVSLNKFGDNLRTECYVDTKYHFKKFLQIWKNVHNII